MREYPKERAVQQLDLFSHLFRIHKQGKKDFRLHSLRKLVKKYVVGKSILDMGCGTGHMTLELLNDGYNVSAFDISQEFVDFTKKLVEEHHYKSDVHVLDLRTAKVLGKNKFDTILCLDVLEHIRDDILAIENLYYLLKHDGYLVVSVPAMKFLYGIRDKKIGHFRRYSKDELIEKLSAPGFEIIDIRYWDFLGVFPFAFSEKILHRRLYEGMRYSRQSFFSRLFNALLDKWFCYIENNVRPMMGLSLIAVCKKVTHLDQNERENNEIFS
jgi:2-polyprenyl-3-methyl-5-hydroxy-6-metoxy-1,4-benzoquinol methylase